MKLLYDFDILLKRDWLRCRRRVGRVSLGERLPFTLPANLLNAFFVVHDSLFNRPLLEEHERLGVLCYVKPLCTW